jgi:calcium-dependent protein kinase
VERLTEEIEILSVLDHPNIIRLFESFQDVKCIYLVLELCNGGELFDRVVEAGYFTESVAAHCVRQMFLAINYLHQNLIIHRDLKPENWLVSTKESMDKTSLKMIDFGISKRCKPGACATSKAGTPNYVAPEVLGGRYT